MQISDYNYTLPKEKIAQYPPEVRGASRLLVLQRGSGAVLDRQYADIVDFLQAGDVLVMNDTKVIKARLLAQDERGKSVELVLLEKHGHDEDRHHHKVLYRGHLSRGDVLHVGPTELSVESIEDGGTAIITSAEDINVLADTQGKVPLPPYMKRDATTEDEQRYQTVFAREKGSVAAPTASLNMTEGLLASLRAKGVVVCSLTLHVGLGTFLPIRSDSVEDHTMHSEYFEIPAETVERICKAKQSSKRVVALGTTVARTLEFAGGDLLETSEPKSLTGEADIFIYPGYDFRVVDALLTNFHAPKSTVLMLAAAFAGWDQLMAAYTHALDEGYAFLSYGDSMLIT
jgi:S-adenosylmethionine:tRNA ribosyltransferase-isomerase